MSLKYRLEMLGWYNFESLVQTLLKEIIGKGVSSFGGSKDGGRDATFRGDAPFPSQTTNWNGNWIFQAKFSESESADSAVRRLGTEVRREMSTILARYPTPPDNYVLISSLPVSSGFRDKLAAEVDELGFKGNFHFIDGREVCQFLDLHPSIRRAFPQLIGLADLEDIFNRDIIARSRAFVAHWQPKLNTFVAVKQYFRALNVLRDYNFVVLDGPPESGKSTIAAAMGLAYACDNFEVLYVRGPEDVFRTYRAGTKQLYFADDAVGSINFDPGLGDQWARDLPAVLVKLDQTHRLVWTVRSYILAEALSSTKLGEQVDDFPGHREVLVEVREFTYFERALILYNHARQAPLSPGAKWLVRKFAVPISHSANFTPERVRQLVSFVLSEVPSNPTREDLATWHDRIEKFMHDPGERFERAFRELGRSEKELLLTLLDLGPLVKRDDLRREYERRVSVL